LESEIINKSTRLTRLRLADGALLFLLVALTVLSPRLIPAGTAGDTLLVRTGGSVFEIFLEADGTYPVKGPLGEAVIMVRDGKAWLLNSPCPLKICEAMGPIREAGDIILCLPNRIHISVRGKEEVDAVSR